MVGRSKLDEIIVFTYIKSTLCLSGDISTLEGTPLKLVDKFTYLGSRGVLVV